MSKKILLHARHKIVGVLVACLLGIGVGVVAYIARQNADPRSVSVAKKEVSSKPKNITGLVLPHHTVASGLVDEFLNDISIATTVKHVIIIGPNHLEAGGAAFVLSDDSWDTGGGKTIPTNASLISSVIDRYKYAAIDTSVVTHDHASYGMIPYINRHLTNVDVTAILVSRNADKSLLFSFADRLSKLISEDDTLVIASVDFSHNVSEEVGRAQDTDTISMMEKRNYDGLLTKHGQEIDSPGSLIILDRIMSNFDRKSFALFKRSSSAIIAGDPTIPEIVSYVFGYYGNE